jgi:hypothetical protein
MSEGKSERRKRVVGNLSNLWEIRAACLLKLFSFETETFSRILPKRHYFFLYHSLHLPSTISLSNSLPRQYILFLSLCLLSSPSHLDQILVGRTHRRTSAERPSRGVERYNITIKGREMFAVFFSLLSFTRAESWSSKL